jgi:hypothetical protein
LYYLLEYPLSLYYKLGSAQQQQQSQQQLAPKQQQKSAGISQLIKQIAQQVSTANPGTNVTHVYQILVQLAKQTASKGQAIQEIRQIYSQVSRYPFGTLSQVLSHFAKQVASGNSNVVQIAQQTIQEKASNGGNITQTLSNAAVQQASGGSKNVNQVIRHAAQILANRAGVPVEKVEAVIIQIALQIAQAQGKDITGQSILQIANQITQNPNGVLAQAILKLVNQDDGGKSSKTTTVIKNVVKSSSSGGGGRDDGDGGGKGNCRDNVFIGNLFCNVGRIIIKPQPNPPIEPPVEEEPEKKICPTDAGVAEFTCRTGKSKEQLCSEQPQMTGCAKEPPEQQPPIVAPGPEVRIPQPGDEIPPPPIDTDTDDDGEDTDLDTDDDTDDDNAALYSGDGGEDSSDSSDSDSGDSSDSSGDGGDGGDGDGGDGDGGDGDGGDGDGGDGDGGDGDGGEEQ